MQTKLTLRLDGDLIRRAKAHARGKGQSVSQMVARYFALLGDPIDTDTELPPLTRDLRGALGDAKVDEGDYRRHLEEKYG